MHRPLLLPTLLLGLAAVASARGPGGPDAATPRIELEEPPIVVGDASSARLEKDWDRRDASRSHPADLYPESRNGRITFYYEDDDYTQVHLVGDFTDWEREPMTLGDDDIWSVRLRVSGGRHQYKFIVEDDGETWEVIDPSNPRSRKTRGHGWVSEYAHESRGRRDRDDDERDDRDDDDRDDWDDDDREGDRRWDPRAYWNAKDELRRQFSHEDIGLDYQRVDGLRLSYTDGRFARGRWEASVLAEVGYAFGSERWGVMASVLQPLAPRGRLFLNLRGRSITDHVDQTGVGNLENLLAAWLVEEDFRDYHEREGVSAGLILFPCRYGRLEGGVHVDDYTSLETVESDLPPNPGVLEGTMRSVYGRLTIGDDDSYVDVSYERSDPDLLTSIATFEQLTTELRGRWDLAPSTRVDARVKMGMTFSGDAPFQRRYHVGGLGTVRGHGYQSLLVVPEDEPTARADDEVEVVPVGGEQMLIANLEYRFELDASFDMVLFADTGMAWRDREQDIDLGALKNSAGVGIDTGDVRLNVAKPFDVEDDDLVFEVRINRTF